MGSPECQLIYASLDPIKKKRAIDFLSSYFDMKKEKIIIRETIQKDPVNWYAPYHFVWGMGIRNLLRQKGFGEKYFKIDNLDDIYVELVEEAVK